MHNKRKNKKIKNQKMALTMDTLSNRFIFSAVAKSYGKVDIEVQENNVI